MDDSPVNLFQLSRTLKLPLSWLKAEADAGRLPCLRVGRGIRLFDLAAVRRSLAERAAKGEDARHVPAVRAAKREVARA